MMSTRMESHGLNGAHTAGIFSDMTIDGPEIGTLVVIVDRAKNLPNRKTIGKQDPYCAARLGKEAKKTETDRRGGQTPRWDQELRFTVHDSPDYYQLKVSVFNDDRKTDIIGENWVDLKDVVVPGGGQSDVWHNLSCKGKYAGEIRVEITYYDTRPKPEKPERIESTATNGLPDTARDSLNGPRLPRTVPKRRPLPSDPVTGAPASPSTMPDPHQTSPRGYESSGYVPNQSPLQNVEYNTPPNRFSRSQGYGSMPSMNGYGTPPVAAATPPAQSFPNDRFEMYDRMAKNDYHEENMPDFYEPQEYNQQPPYQMHQPDDFQPSSPDGPPPPPPAHRIQPGSTHASPGPSVPPYPKHIPNGLSSDFQARPHHDAHGHSMPAVSRPPHSPQNSQNGSYQPYHESVDEDQFRAFTGQNSYPQNPPRHHSYDAQYHGSQNNSYGQMQPRVEDAPSSPGSMDYSRHRSNSSNPVPYEDRGFDQVPSPAPLNLSGRGSTASSIYSSSIGPNSRFSNASSGYAPTSSSRTSYSSGLPQSQPPSKQSEESMSGTPVGFGLPPVPPTLVAGMDPTIAKEISDRIYQEKRASVSVNRSMENSPRGRYQDPPRQQQNRPHSLSYNDSIQTSFVPAAPSFEHARPGPAPVVKPRSTSPNPNTIPARKRVSPSPMASEGKKISTVPFGPDSYNALNPNISSSAPNSFSTSPKDMSDFDPNAKIITHDGREIDPSDHIPESNYAPLYVTKGPKCASQQPDRNYRPPTGPQQMPSQGRQPLRQQARVQTVPAPSLNHQIRPDPSTPPTSRNRLQKKANRMAAQPATNSSPLAPITSYQDNNNAPRSLPRPNTAEYSNENYAPNIYSGSPGYRGAGPPIPAKVPMGGPPEPMMSGGAGDPWALLEEMRSIDLGSGRARRRGH